MSGILRYGTYIPLYRLTRQAMGGGKGERAIASYDEDSVSMAVEAARQSLGAYTGAVDTLMFATTSPPYAEKLNAAAIAAALDLPGSIASIELGTNSRMGLAALALGADLGRAGRISLVCAGDVVVGGPGGKRERESGDAAVAFVTGPKDEAIAKVIGRASATSEVLDVWRLPEDAFARQWEERFGVEVLGPVSVDTAKRAVENAGIAPETLSAVILDATNKRDVAGIPRALGLRPEQVSDMHAASIGRSGVAHAGLVLAKTLDDAHAGDRILVLSTADGCDALVIEVTERIEQGRPARSVGHWLASKRDDLPYNDYLKWRGILPFEPPRRPDPERPSGPMMKRHENWKYAFYGSRCENCGQGHLPPQRVCVGCKSVDEMKDERYADEPCRITTYTLDHLAYSLQPPVVSMVVDFDSGGRVVCELTDGDPDAVKIGDRLEMTFRRFYTGQGVHNYFWKARPQR
ncbi:MAG: OB-fold domain-containing protein [Gammaproteobacteria bacterium]|nr:OB-fold domain-containing protein [Gammaproteobacteria bacterium]